METDGQLDKEIANMMGISGSITGSGSGSAAKKPEHNPGTMYARPEPIVETIFVKLTITTYPNGQKFMTSTAWNPEAKFKTYQKPKKTTKAEVKTVSIGQEEIL